MRVSIQNKTVVMGVCGGIAAYKSLELLRLLKKSGADVKVLMTKNALNFVGLTSFQALSENPVCTDLFDKNGQTIQHIQWAKEADAVIIAPATANIIGKFASGIADDALSTFLLAAVPKKPVILCPSMNSDMLDSFPVRNNLSNLESNGCFIINPGIGDLACGVNGPGRLPEPEYIIDRLLAILTPKDLIGKKVVVTAGPTVEPIDPVRFISNHSSGKMGFAMAKAAEYRGAKVILISGQSSIAPPVNVSVTKVKTASEMAKASFLVIDTADIIIKTAAVADYRPELQNEHKIKKSKDSFTLNLVKNIDILKEIGKRKTSDQILVGFAAETQDLKRNASQKLKDKNLDMIVGNIVGENIGFGTDSNKVTLFYKDGSQEAAEEMHKEDIAHIILDKIVEKHKI